MVGPPPRLFKIKTNKVISRTTEMAKIILVDLLIRVFLHLFAYYLFRPDVTGLAPVRVRAGGHGFDDSFPAKGTFDQFVSKSSFIIDSWFPKFAVTSLTNQ